MAPILALKRDGNVVAICFWKKWNNRLRTFSILWRCLKNEPCATLAKIRVLLKHCCRRTNDSLKKICKNRPRCYTFSISSQARFRRKTKIGPDFSWMPDRQSRPIFRTFQREPAEKSPYSRPSITRRAVQAGDSNDPHAPCQRCRRNRLYQSLPQCGSCWQKIV